MKLTELEGAAKLDPKALRRVLDQIQIWATGMEGLVGLDPLAPAGGGAIRVATPPLFDFNVTAESGEFTVEILVPAGTGPVVHEIKTSDSVPFVSSQTVTSYSDNPSTLITITAPGATKFFQLRSRFLMSDFNKPQVKGPFAAGSAAASCVAFIGPPADAMIWNVKHDLNNVDVVMQIREVNSGDISGEQLTVIDNNNVRATSVVNMIRNSRILIICGAIGKGVAEMGLPGLQGPPGADGRPGADGSDAISQLLPNHVTNINLAPTGSVTLLETVPSTAFVCAPGYFRNEGTAGFWIIAFGGITPSSSSYAVKLGPGDSTLVTLGEAYKEANMPVGTVKAFHTAPGAGAGNLTGFIAWNDGTSPLAGPTGPRGPYGGPITVDYLFSSQTGNADPGSGNFRLNTATQNAATALYINTTSFDGAALAGVLDNLFLIGTTPTSVLRIVKKDDITKFLMFYVTALISHSGYREYTLLNVTFSTASPFADTNECLLCIDSIGAQGSSGSKYVNNFRLSLVSGDSNYSPQNATPSSTDTTNDTVTFATDPVWATGTISTPASTGGGLTAGTKYFIRQRSANLYSFHTSVAGAEGDTAKVDLTANITQQITVSGVSRTKVFVTPHNGNEIGLFDGVSTWNVRSSAEFSINLGTLTANLPYDLFCYDSAGTPTLELLAWTSDSARATAIVQQNGVWVKNGATTRRLLGTIRTDSTTTTIDDAGGIISQVGAKRFVGNVDNRLPRHILEWDSVSSFNYSTATWQQFNNNGGNQVEAVFALPAWASIQINQTVSCATTSPLGAGGINLDSVIATPLITDSANNAGAGAIAVRQDFVVLAGYHKFVWMQSGNGVATVTWYGRLNQTFSAMSGCVLC